MIGVAPFLTDGSKMSHGNFITVGKVRQVALLLTDPARFEFLSASDHATFVLCLFLFLDETILFFTYNRLHLPFFIALLFEGLVLWVLILVFCKWLRFIFSVVGVLLVPLSVTRLFTRALFLNLVFAGFRRSVVARAAISGAPLYAFSDQFVLFIDGVKSTLVVFCNA